MIFKIWVTALALGATLPLAAADDLFQAIRRNDVAAVRQLVDAAADVNAKDKAGATPLMHATVYSTVECMKLLIDKGADVNAAAESGRTALHSAIGEIDKVKLLLAHGANVDAEVKARNATPLKQAARKGDGGAVAMLLLAKGAKPTPSALRSAAVHGNIDLMQALMKAGVSVKGNDGTSALVAAADAGMVEAAKLLLAAGADPNGKLGSDTTPLGTAAFNGNIEIARLLLAAGAKADEPGREGWTPLMLASGTDHQNAALVKLLVEKGADATKKDKNGETAVDWARKVGDTKAARLLGVKQAATSAEMIAAGDSLVPVRTAVQKAITVMEPAGPVFFQKNACISCHHQSIMQMAVAKVRSHGIAIDPKIEKQQVSYVVAAWKGHQESLLANDCAIGGFIANVSYGLIGLAASGYKADELTDAVAHCLAHSQEPDGSWYISDTRAPLGIGRVKWTALSMRALELYTPPGLKHAYGAHLQKGRQYLERANPTDTQGLVFQLLGLKWAGAPDEALAKVARKLAGLQRASGGWAQRREMHEDAFATGQALWALHDAGSWQASAAAYQKGAQYLRRTQQADGSWHVKTRAFGFQPLRDTGFPHGRDQWISSAATGFAVMALAPLIEETKSLAVVQ